MSKTLQKPIGVIDACCLVNILSTQDPSTILRHTGCQWHVPSAVKLETIYVYRHDPQGNLVKEPVGFESLIATGCLFAHDPSPEDELELYMRLAAVLGEGEAMAMAAAKYNNWLLATDDRKARKVAGELHVKLVTTPELIHQWSAVAKPGTQALAKVISDIQSYARFIPRADAPLYDWWVRQQMSLAK